MMDRAGRAHVAPGNRRVEHMQSPFPASLLDLAGKLGTRGCHIDQEGTFRSPLDNTASSKIGRFDVRGKTDDRDDDPGTLGGLSPGCRTSGLPMRSVPQPGPGSYCGPGAGSRP
ncbi:MAG: hypothetical protein R3F07_12740 [Opitutaceae bacterium]